MHNITWNVTGEKEGGSANILVNDCPYLLVLPCKIQKRLFFLA
jgi:hypothetical protein